MRHDRLSTEGSGGACLHFGLCSFYNVVLQQRNKPLSISETFSGEFHFKDQFFFFLPAKNTNVNNKEQHNKVYTAYIALGFFLLLLPGSPQHSEV